MKRKAPKEDDAPKKKSKENPISLLSEALKSEAPFTDLQKALDDIQNEELENGPDHIQKFFVSGGQLTDLLKLLDPEKGQLKSNEIQTVFRVLELCVLRVATDITEYRKNGENLATFLLKSHLRTVYNALAPSVSAELVKTTLRLLTALVTLGAASAKEILGNLDFDHVCIGGLLERRSGLKEQPDVRTTYLYFLMAFLMEDDTTLLRTLIDKRGVLQSIFYGMARDTVDSLQILLPTLKDRVVLSPSLSKTAKMRVFNSTTLMYLMQLYKWEGPSWHDIPADDSENKFVSKKKAKQSVEDTGGAQDIMESQATFEDDSDTVAQAVHDLLLTLISSRKHGLVFVDHSLGLSGRNGNTLVFQALESLGRPWEAELPRELAIAVLNAAPDLMVAYWPRWEAEFKPRISQSWQHLVAFLRSVIELQNLVVSFNPKDPYSPRILVDRLLTLILPSPIHDPFFQEALSLSEVVVQSLAIRLALTIFAKVEEFLKLLEGEKGGPYNAKEKANVKSLLLKTLRKTLPPVATLLNLWNDFLSKIKDGEEETADKWNCVVYLMDLLTKYQIHQVHQIPASEILTQVMGLPTFDTPEYMKLQVSVFQLVSVDSSSYITMDTELLNRILKICVAKVDETLRSNARDLFKRVLSQTGLMGELPHEVDIWFVPWREEVLDETVAGMLSQASAALISEPAKYKEEWANEVQKYGDQRPAQIGTQINKLIEAMFEEDFLDKISIICPADSDVRSAKASVWGFSPLLVTWVEVLKAKGNNKAGKTSPSVKMYFSEVVLHLVHCQSQPQVLIRYLVKNARSSLTPNVQNYLQGWLEASVQDTRTLWMKNASPFFPPVCQYLFEIFLFKKELEDAEEEWVGLLQRELAQSPRSAVKALIVIRQIWQYLRLSDNANTFITLAQVTFEQTSSGPVLEHVVPAILSHPHALQSYEDPAIQQLLLPVMQISYGNPHLVTYVQPYRSLLFSSTCERLQKGDLNLTADVTTQFDLFDWTSADLTHLIQLLSSRPSIDELNPNCLGLLALLLRRLARLRLECTEPVSHVDLVRQVEKFYTEIQPFAKGQIHLGVLEDALAFLYTVVPSLVATASKSFGSAVCKSGSRANLAKLLLQYNPNFRPTLEKHLSKHPICLEDWRLPLALDLLEAKDCGSELRTNFLSNDAFFRALALVTAWPDKRLVQLYTEWLGRQSASVWQSLCGNIAEFIGRKTEAFLRPATFGSILRVVLASSGDGKRIPVAEREILQTTLSSLINITLEYATQLVQQKTTISDPEGIIARLDELTQELEAITADGDTKPRGNRIVALEDSLTANLSFDAWVKAALKKGLKLKLEKSETAARILAALLASWRFLRFVYTGDKGKEVLGAAAEHLHSLISSHSDFLSVFLDDERKYVTQKTELVALLLDLVQTQPSLAQSSHVGVILAAYQPNLAPRNQNLLRMIHFYEQQGVALHLYKPYAFGPSAIARYNVKQGWATRLTQQTQAVDVLTLLEPDLMYRSAYSFPVNVDLEPSLVTDVAEECYDPRFLLPLLSGLMAPEVIVPAYRLIGQGIPAFLLAALASSYVQVRLAAWHALSRLYEQLQLAKTWPERGLWINLIDIVRRGAVTEAKQRSEAVLLKEAEHFPPGPSTLRLPNVIALFLAKAAGILTRPLDPMYKPINNFLLVKPALDLREVPEFFVLWHSTELQGNLHRQFVLELLRDGMRDKIDFVIGAKRSVYRLLLAFQPSVLAENGVPKLILELVQKAVQIPSVAYSIVLNGGLLAWLRSLAPMHSQSVLQVAVALWDTLRQDMEKKRRQQVDHSSGETEEDLKGLEEENADSDAEEDAAVRHKTAAKKKSVEKPPSGAGKYRFLPAEQSLVYPSILVELLYLIQHLFANLAGPADLTWVNCASLVRIWAQAGLHWKEVCHILTPLRHAMIVPPSLPISDTWLEQLINSVKKNWPGCYLDVDEHILSTNPTQDTQLPSSTLTSTSAEAFNQVSIPESMKAEAQAWTTKWHAIVALTDAKTVWEDEQRFHLHLLIACNKHRVTKS